MNLDLILLFIVLLVLMIVAYRILKLILQTVIVAVFSGVFYVVLAYSGFNLELNITKIFLFMVLGSFLFIVYSSIAFTYSFWHGIFIAPYRFLKRGVGKKDKKKSKSTSSKDRREKEVILRELQE